MFLQAVETGVQPSVTIPTGEEYKTLSKEKNLICHLFLGRQLLRALMSMD
jgi:hypothetical protein